MLELTSDNIQQEVKDHDGLVVIDFWAPWCGPCRMYSKIFEQAANSIESAKFVKLNIDDWEGTLPYPVQNIPATVFVKDGKEVDRLVGMQTFEELEQVCLKHED